MVLLGLLSFLQIVFIPGYIFIQALDIKTSNKLEFIAYSFGISLLINYNLVYLLTLTGIYKPLTLYVLFSLETVAIAFFVFKKKHMLKRPFLDTTGLMNTLPSGKALFIIAGLVTAAFSYFFFANLGTVFTGWDPVFSWNRWAVDWYLNEIPVRTYLYPQLIPANFSVSYQFMQNHYIQLFSKSIMPLFTIFTSFLFLSLYLVKRDLRALVSSIVFSGIILVFGLNYINTGYVDIAVAFFSFAAVYETIKEDKLTNRKIVLVLLLASAAAMTKFIGIVVFVYCLLWVIVKLVRIPASGDGIRNKKISILITAGITILHLHWYLVKAIQITMGIEYSYIRFLTQDIHHDLNIFERFANGLKFFPLWAIVIFFIIIFLVLSSLFERKARYISLFVTIPLIMIWGFYFSYDDRNLMAAIPFMAFSSSYGLSFYFKKCIRVINKRQAEIDRSAKRIKTRSPFPRYRLVLIMALVVFLALSVMLYFLGDDIYKDQINRQKALGDPCLNERLYEYKENNDIDKKIITDYYWVTSLPGFEGSSIRTFKENDAFIIISNSDSYDLVNPVDLADDDTYGFLISNNYYLKFYESFSDKIENNSYQKIFECGGFHFIRILS